jgi:hypothetical protein
MRLLPDHYWLSNWTYLKQKCLRCVQCEFLPVTQEPNSGLSCFVVQVSRSHTMTHHSRDDSSRRVIGPSQRPPPDNKQHSQWTDIYDPCRFLSQFLLFFHLCAFSVLDSLSLFSWLLSLCFLYNTHHIHPYPRWDLFIISCTLFVLHPYLHLCLDCPAFCLLSVLSLHNTSILAPGGIRIRNPSKRGATSARHIPGGHWKLLSVWMQYPNAWLGVHLELNQPEHFVCRGS